jgi:FixJ family two-component response regulator
MSGRELATTLLREHPGLRVMYVSGYADATLAELGVERGDAGFLAKPYTPASLLAKVREVLTMTQLTGAR